MGNHYVGKMFVVGISILSDDDIDNLTQEKRDKIQNKFESLNKIFNENYE